MINLIKVIAILLLVPALIAAEGCQISVSSKLQHAQNRNNVYEGTINNIGSAAASNVVLSSSVDLRSVSGLQRSHDGYSLPHSVGEIEAGSSYTFKYTVKSGTNAVWTASCTDSAVEPPTAPTSRPKHPTTAPTSSNKHTTTTTAAPTKKHTTAAPTSSSKHTTAAPTTKAATSAPTTKAATSAPTTKAATSAPTTKAATSAPTTKAATSAPTSAPTASGSGKKCAGNTWWSPSPQTTYQWQLTGTIDTSINVQMYDIDLFDNTVATIQKLHSDGRFVICYFSTQYENWRPDASSFTSAVLGNNLDDWAGEKYVDIRSTVVRNIMTARMALAASKGCDGVEPDNVDGYEANTGFPITAADQLDFNKFIASAAHAVGLSVGLKNDVDQASTLQPFFDWALNEQCKEYDECNTLSSFISNGKAVFNTEYSGSGSSVCPYMVGLKFSSLIKTLDLTAAITAECCTYQTGGCTPAPYTCVSATKARDAEQAPAEITPQETSTANNILNAAASLVGLNL